MLSGVGLFESISGPPGPSFSIGLSDRCRGWSGGTKVACILSHLGIQLILAYSWARPAILVAGKGGGWGGGECFY